MAMLSRSKRAPGMGLPERVVKQAVWPVRIGVAAYFVRGVAVVESVKYGVREMAPRLLPYFPCNFLATCLVSCSYAVAVSSSLSLRLRR